MDQSCLVFGDDGTGLSTASFAQKLSEKVVKRVSRQLARPKVAGFQARLDREDYNALLKNVASDKIDVLLDEFMVEYGGRRSSLIEELHAEDQVPIRELFYGEPGLMFGIIGEASTGKTSLLLHLQWRINCRHNKILRELEMWDKTWAYFQVPDSESSSPPMTAAAPLPFHSTSQVGSATSGAAGSMSGHNSVTGDDLGLRGLGSSLFQATESPKCPTRFLGIYTFGSELLRREVGPTGAFDLNTVLESAYSTYLLRLPFGQIPVDHDEYIQAFKAVINDSERVGIILLVDGFDFVEPSQRAALLSSLALTLQHQPSLFFRLFFGSRPNGLFKLEELPDSVIFLCLDRLFSADWKEKLLARIAPEVATELQALGRDSIEARIHRRLIRSCHSPLLVFLLAQLRKQIQANSAGLGSTGQHVELTACLYDMFDNFFQLIVQQSKLVRGEPLDAPKTFRVGSMELSEKEFHQLVDIVVFFYHCWIPETFRRDWSTRERFEHLTFYLFKYQAAYLNNTVLGRLREHFLQQRLVSKGIPQVSPTSGVLPTNPGANATAGLGSALNTTNSADSSASSASAATGSASSSASSPAMPGNTGTPTISSQSSTSNIHSALYDTAFVDCANTIWKSVAEWLVSVGLAHRLTSTVRGRNHVNSTVAANQASIQAILQAPNLSAAAEQPLSPGISPAAASPTMPSSGSSTPSNGFCLEILLKDEQQVQFQCARFLMNTELSSPILIAIHHARTSMRGFDAQYPNIFSWQSDYFLTNKHWNYIYDMMASKKGVIWLAKTILPPQVSIYDWLAQMRLSKGVDKDDLGQIRFYRLLRGFALEQEDRDLLHLRQRALQEAKLASISAQDSSSHSSLKFTQDTLSTSENTAISRSSLSSISSEEPSSESPLLISGPTSVSPNTRGRMTPLPKTAQEVEIADLKEAFGMTFVSILEDNASAIVHIEKAPVSSLACFSQNAISIILDKMVLLLKQGNIFVVADLLINLDRHGLINQDIINKVVEMVTTSKDYKPIRPTLRFLSSRTPSHRHLGAIISCLAAKDQDAQNEAMEALTTVAQTSVEAARESFQRSVLSSSSNAVLGDFGNDGRHGHNVPNTTAFGPFEADLAGAAQSGRGHVSGPKIPADMVITERQSPKRPAEELYLMEEVHEAESTSTGKAQSASSSTSNLSTAVQHPSASEASTPQLHRSSFPGKFPSSQPIPFLFGEREWSILLRSSISLLVDFVGLDIHKSTKNSNYYNNPFEPRVRMIQCKHLASLIEMMESDEAGTRLLPFILLGNTIRSNDYEREAERQQLEAQIFILEAIGKVYSSHRRIGDVEHDLIEELARNSPSIRGIGYIFHDLLGLQAAKYAVMSEDLIKTKPDLLVALNSWAFARLNAEHRRSIFLALSIHDKILVQQSILDLVSNNSALIEAMDPTDLTAVIAGNFGKKDAPISLKRAALRFLELSALTTHSQDYRLHSIDKILFLLGRYGFNDPVVTEPVLRILDTILSTPIANPNTGSPSSSSAAGFSGSGSRGFISSFQTPSPFLQDPPRPTLTPQEHKELHNLLQRNNMRQKLMQAFDAQSSARFWVGKVLTCSLLRHFVSSDSEDALEYVQLLKSNVPEIRSIALSELHRIDGSLVPALLQRLKELISYEEPLVRTTYSLVIGALGMRPEQQSMAIDVACYLMSQTDSPDVQQHGVSILSIMGENVSESVLVSSRVEEILQQKTAIMASGAKITVEENGLLMVLIECITNVRLTSTPVLLSMLGLIRESGDPSLRSAICLAFKRLSCDLQLEQRAQCQEQVLTLLQNREGYVREIAIKLIRFLGRETVKHTASRLVKMISDPELYVRKQAIKAVTVLLHKGDDQAKKEALLLLPAVSSALEDKSPLVIVQALRFLVLLKARTRSVSVTLARLAARAAQAQPTGPDAEDDAQISIDSEGIPVLSHSGSSRSLFSHSTPTTVPSAQSPTSGSDLEDDDPWYVRKVIIPNLDRISSLLYRRRYRFNLAIKVGILECLGTTRLLQPHLNSFTEMLNSENVPTLVEFSDTMRRLGPGMLQYIPSIVNSIKPGSPLVRNMVRLLARYEKQMDARTCSRLFSLQTILSMMKNKDANVRKVAISLMGKKVLEKSKHIWVIIQMWGDKNNKVRKEVMEVLGDIGKTNPEYISHIMNLIDTDSVSSILVWRFLSKSWGILIGNIPGSSSDGS
jgi:hypothetical protein